jgi:hypothetical protein
MRTGLIVVVAAFLSACSAPPNPLQTELARCNAIGFLPERAACEDHAYAALREGPAITSSATTSERPPLIPAATRYIEPEATDAPISLQPDNYTPSH